jgi:hypothetical protein
MIFDNQSNGCYALVKAGIRCIHYPGCFLSFLCSYVVLVRLMLTNRNLKSKISMSLAKCLMHLENHFANQYIGGALNY